ncbi:MAG: hypothetical protein Q8K36_04120, partial [Alphaproteobacteria bacterium]|nr:hypothetical protein [Alphaproteobacteria bacterium]
FGERFDPFADKMMMTAIYLAMGLSQIIPLWCVAVILLRDVFIILGALIVMMGRKNVPLHPLFLSKLNTVFQILLAGWLVAYQYLISLMPLGYPFHLFTNIVLYGTLLLTLLSGLQYAQRFAYHIAKK